MAEAAPVRRALADIGGPASGAGAANRQRRRFSMAGSPVAGVHVRQRLESKRPARDKLSPSAYRRAVMACTRRGMARTCRYKETSGDAVAGILRAGRRRVALSQMAVR